MAGGPDRVLSAGKSRPEGFKIIFELTNQCNFHCLHCLRNEESSKRYLSEVIVEKVLAEVESYHVPLWIALTGGEPTLHPRLASIAGRIANRGLQFAFVTNGWNFQETLERLAPDWSAILHVTFSLDGATESIHDLLRQRQGSFRRVLQGITLCKFRGIPSQINMVVTRGNRKQLQEMALLASRLGCSALAFGHCQPTPDSLAADLVLDPPARRRVEAEIASLQKTLRLEIRLAGDHFQPSLFHQCSQLRMQEFNIDYRGYLTACCMLSSFRGGHPDTEVIADLNEVSFYEAHRRLLAKIAIINGEKLDRVSKGGASECDHFICHHCLQHYGKLSETNEKPIPVAGHDPANIC